jgi:hypothetical protein
MVATFATPGVYTQEINAFPNAVVPVATAVPAFIGYTPRADYKGKSYFNKPQKITSFLEFKAIFMLEDPTPPADPSRQYSPEYYLVAQKNAPTSGDSMVIGGQHYSILPDPDTIYYLYNAVRLFYENGGGDAYIVAVGPYGPASKKPMTDPSADIVNANVQLDDLLGGLALLKNEEEPTMYVFPEATLLSLDDNGTLMQSALEQAAEMRTVMCLFDVIGGANPDPVLFMQDIQNFRDRTGTTGLDFGACYYPFIGTTIMQSSDIDFTNLFGGDTAQLQNLLSPPSAPNPAVDKIIGMIQSPPAAPMSNSQLQKALLNASQLYTQIVGHVMNSANMMPPSGAMAGVYALNDSMNGVWSAPANVSIVGAASLPIRLSDKQQDGLNVDAVSGKSINAIRYFPGQGILVWGARTLDGNSDDWRYVPVRRTATFVENSVKLAARAYVFEPNNKNTWSAVKSMVTTFMTSVWNEGGLQGASAGDAFQVGVGLGVTMTADDMLGGFMRVSVAMALTRPAEFVVVTYEQQQPKS